MLKMTIDNEEVLSNNDISIKEEILSPSSTILNNVYPKSWEQDKDYTSRFYYPKDYSKLNIQNFSVEPEEAGTTIQINGSATLTDVDTSKESRVLRLLGQTSQVQYTGKNLLHQDQYITTRTTNGITFTNNGDGTFSITGTATANTNMVILSNTQVGLESGKTYYLYSSQPYNSQTFNMSIPFKQDGTQKYLTVNNSITTSGELTSITLAFYTNSGNTINAQNVKLMLVEGSTPGDYEPYVGGTASPNPSYPQNVNVVSGDNTIDICGKNLEQEIELGGISNTGQNYVNNNQIRSKYYNSVAPNTTYALSFNGALSGFNVAQYDKDKTFISFTYAYQTITTSENTRYIRVNKTGTLNDKVQIEKGSTATTYEPYIGSSYPLYLGVENLFDKDNYNIAYGYTGGGLILSGYNTSSTDRGFWVKLQPNTTYTLDVGKLNTGTDKIIGFYSQQPTTNGISAGSRQVFSTNASSINYTFTTDSTNIYLHSKLYNSSSFPTYTLNEILESIQLQKGSQINYTSTTPIELCKIGTYQDYIYKDNGSWYLHKEIGKVVLTGASSEIWSRSGASTSSSFVGALNLPYSGVSNKFGTGSNWFCDKFTYGYLGVDYKFNTYNGDATTGYQFFGLTIPTTMASDLSSFKTWLSNNNVEVYYVLATPTNTEITDTTLISQLESLSS